MLTMKCVCGAPLRFNPADNGTYCSGSEKMVVGPLGTRFECPLRKES